MTDDLARLRRIHGALVARCAKPHNALYAAARADMCPEWSVPRKGVNHFLAWGAEAGFSLGCHLARLDPSRPYGPDNCEWRPGREPRDARNLVQGTFRGRKMAVEDIAAHPDCVVPLGALKKRLSNGWTFEAAATTPPRWSTRPTKVRAFGERKSITAWGRDPRCVVTADSLHNRLARGMSPELAITMPARR